MVTRRKKSKDEAIEGAIRAAGTVGQLERLAGIDGDEARTTFWRQYREIGETRDGEAYLKAGSDELKRRIRAQGLPS